MKKTLFTFLFGVGLLVPTAVSAHGYTVVEGDTLGEIAEDKGIALVDLRNANNKYDDLILVGQTLELPNEAPTPASGKQAVSTGITQVDKDLLARIVRAETTGEPYAGKVAVALVVLNRVDSNQFPNTIKGVIYQKGQFTPVSNGEVNKPASAVDYKAVNEAIAFRGQGAGSLFFYNPRIATNKWLDSKTTTIVIGNHVFKK